jgi:hypothetical protein
MTLGITCVGKHAYHECEETHTQTSKSESKAIITNR